MNLYDVIVVGAGPAGATAATVAARHGAKVLLLEEHTQIGRPIQCTGLLSIRGWRLARLPKSLIVREITGVRAHAPDGSFIDLGGERVRAYVIDRDRFDQALVERAKQTGVEVRTGVRAVSLEAYKNDHRTLWVESRDGLKEKLRARVVVGADGAHGLVARQAELPPPKKRLLGLQAIVQYTAPRPDFVEVFFGERWTGGFFAWAVPERDGSARVGLATERLHQAKESFEHLRAERCAGGEILCYQSGMIPIGLPERTVADGVVLVGDAAGQAKPTSGGGIYTGMLCGKIAGEVAAKAALQGDSTARALREYEVRWRAKLERELTLGFHAQQILTQLSDAQLTQLLKLLREPELRALVEHYGDIDYPSKIARELVKRPRLWKHIWPALPLGVTQYLRMLLV
ncbi:MAG: NAD(P)/FAD-dependent oxidoreductase [Candidatus Bipolaricaulota bacterium]|nr:NAD(P)/FAD-dependent oxidoreductase [Candidatus Bipolaricaulota bacterium]MDW8110788.1 NAD(P)/FAD-dependent oxidoreductase [Candidatus Bipolaricaulota bacterium]MDW8328731.1 NAD(P)/FAD-dependent oxidoreductase [Candidatus Bipolaricaulota bacterium]